jgi:lipopolysaccharide export system permease protein
LAFPLLSFIMVLIGIPIALMLKKGGPPLAVCLGISACFLYILIYGLTRSFGYAGILPPILTAWLANFVFLFLGAYLMMRVET